MKKGKICYRKITVSCSKFSHEKIRQLFPYYIHADQHIQLVLPDNRTSTS
jgi:hypothetical protein